MAAPQKEASGAKNSDGDATDPGVALAEFCASYLDDYTPTVNHRGGALIGVTSAAV